MPASLPGMSVTKAAEVLQTQDKIIKSFPRSRRSTARPAAPTPPPTRRRPRCSRRSSTSSPTNEWRPGMTTDKLIAEMDKALQFPGVANAWTMPIKARIDMLSTGIRTPIGIKVFGKDLARWRSWPRRSRRGQGAGHHQRLRRAHHRRLLPQHRADRAATGPLRLPVGELQDVVATGARRRDGHDHRRGAASASA